MALFDVTNKYNMYSKKSFVDNGIKIQTKKKCILVVKPFGGLSFYQFILHQFFEEKNTK